MVLVFMFNYTIHLGDVRNILLNAQIYGGMIINVFFFGAKIVRQQYKKTLVKCTNSCLKKNAKNSFFFWF